MTFDNTGAIFTSLVTANPPPHATSQCQRAFSRHWPIKLGDLLPAKVVISLNASGFLPASPPPTPGNFRARARDIAQAGCRCGEH